jgi:cell division cycle protein 20 (cofactor of APC complex)
MNMDLCRRALLTGEKRRRDEGPTAETPSPSTAANSQETPLQKEFKRRMLSSLCNVPLDQLDEDAQPTGILSFGSKSEIATKNASLRLENPYIHDTLRGVLQPAAPDLDPVSHGSVSKKIHRKVSSAPSRILDAPDIVDDYYLNLISWGKDNILAVALAQSVYLWNANNGKSDAWDIFCLLILPKHAFKIMN